MIIDFHRNKGNNGPITLNDLNIEIFESFKFFGNMISMTSNGAKNVLYEFVFDNSLNRHNSGK